MHCLALSPVFLYFNRSFGTAEGVQEQGKKVNTECSKLGPPDE